MRPICACTQYAPTHAHAHVLHHRWAVVNLMPLVLHVHSAQVKLDDGAVRNTLATATTGNIMPPLPPDAEQHCPDFAEAAQHLREAVAMTGTAYAGVLDKLFYGDAACTTNAQCFTGAVSSAESLEHFHLFEPSTAASSRHMLDMHSDIGLFLVMTPAELFRSLSAAGKGGNFSGNFQATPGQRAHDLVVELPDGRIVTPVLPAGALLVMNGEGLTRWMASPLLDHVRPYTPLHEVLSSNMGGGVRAWFGRMYMPPALARLQVADHATGASGSDQHGGSLVSRKLLSVAQQITFGEYRQQTYVMFREGKGSEASAAGCSPSRRRLTDEGSCAADAVRGLASGNGLAFVDLV